LKLDVQRAAAGTHPASVPGVNRKMNNGKEGFAMSHRTYQWTVYCGLFLCWLALAGAKGGCLAPASECEGLDEVQCLANSECRAVWRDSGAEYNGLRCGLGTRCIDVPVFDHCEDKPDCQDLGEQECLAEAECQAVYGYPEDWMSYDGTRDAAPQCTGTRCIPEPNVFLECLDAGADPCANLSETDCLRRPICEPIYDWGCPVEAGGAIYDPSHPCQEGGGYVGCQRIADQCRTDADCAVYYGAEREADMYCPNMIGRCVEGQCVYECVFDCRSNADCPEGYVCELPVCKCGPEYPDCCADVLGQCVPAQQDCTVTGCPEGYQCQTTCWDCAPDNEDCQGGCVSECVPVQQDCQITGCPEGFECQVTCLDWCDESGFAPECCFGTCVPVQQGCQSDADCPAGYVCQFMPCDCHDNDPECFEKCREVGGTCVPVQQDCTVTGCPEGQECQYVCPPCEPGYDCDAYCSFQCVPASTECYADSDCRAGEVCDFGNAWCDQDAWCGGVCVPGVWMVNVPLQCEQTVWELDAAAFPDRYYGCMVDCAGGTDCGTGWEELCVLETFLSYQGVTVHDARNVQMGDGCMACGCARGNQLFVLVTQRDMELLFRFGFSVFGAM
jgi:hypothetical protein